MNKSEIREEIFKIPGADLGGTSPLPKFRSRKHASPNSGQTEAVCAGALDIRLAGDAYYFGELHKKYYIGDDNRFIENEDIRRANRLMYCSAIITLLILRVGDIMSVGFEKVYLMQNGMNLAASEIISTYEYSVGLAGS